MSGSKKMTRARGRQRKKCFKTKCEEEKYEKYRKIKGERK